MVFLIKQVTFFCPVFLWEYKKGIVPSPSRGLMSPFQTLTLKSMLEFLRKGCRLWTLWNDAALMELNVPSRLNLLFNLIPR